MDSRALKNIVDVFRDFKTTYLSQGSLPQGEITLGDEEATLFSRGGYFFFLRGEALEKYKKFLSKWDRAPWKYRWSDAYRSDKVQDAIVRAWNETDGGAEVFGELADHFDSEPERFTAWIPLSGIDLQVAELRIGEVRLIRMTPERTEEILNAVNVISKSVKNDEKTKEQYLAYVRQTLAELHNVTCAEVITAGNPDWAQELAENACLPVIDLLQLVVGLFVDPDANMRVDFRSFEAAGYRSVLLLSDDKSHFVPTRRRFGSMGTCALTQDRLAKLNTWHLSHIVEILEKADKKRTEVERYILRAVHWFADGELQRNPENRLQSYVTCLDMFFSSRQGEATAAVQEGVAYLMGHDAAQRAYLHEFIGKVYDYRSRASHEGEQFNLPTMLRELRVITINLIAVVVKRRAEFPTKKSIRRWVHNEKMK